MPSGMVGAADLLYDDVAVRGGLKPKRPVEIEVSTNRPSAERQKPQLSRQGGAFDDPPIRGKRTRW